MKWVPNSITMLRIVGTIALLFIEPLTSTFFIIYCIAGFTDVLDGFIARTWHVTSESGARLDSIADLLYYFVMIVKVFPILKETMSVKFWRWIAAILVIRACSYLIAFINHHTMAALHTILNKMTGFAVFLVPIVIAMKWNLRVYCVIAAVIATVASVYELMIHIHDGLTSSKA